MEYLWEKLTFPEAIHVAKRASFDWADCHQHSTTPAGEIYLGLREIGLKMIGLNTRLGDMPYRENVSLIPTLRATEVRWSIDDAIAYPLHAWGKYSFHGRPP